MKQPAKAKHVQSDDWITHTPDGWSLDEIVCDNINDAIEYFIGELCVHPVMEKPGTLKIYGGFDSVSECGKLREVFKWNLVACNRFLVLTRGTFFGFRAKDFPATSGLLVKQA